jgi:hypothetical protein
MDGAQSIKKTGSRISILYMPFYLIAHALPRPPHSPPSHHPPFAPQLTALSSSLSSRSGSCRTRRSPSGCAPPPRCVSSLPFCLSSLALGLSLSSLVLSLSLLSRSRFLSSLALSLCFCCRSFPLSSQSPSLWFFHGEPRELACIFARHSRRSRGSYTSAREPQEQFVCLQTAAAFSVEYHKGDREVWGRG